MKDNNKNIDNYRNLALNETLALLQMESSKVGITRLAEITYLDRIGIPTWQAIRPNALSLCVSQGKGISDSHAKISALMESIEYYCWETYNPEFEWITIKKKDVIMPDVFPEYIYNTEIRDDFSLPMSKVKDIISENFFYVLHDLLSITRDSCFVKYPKWAYCSTNGVSGGATINEAILYAIFEIIERDSESCATSFFSESFFRPNILIKSIDIPVIQNLIDKIYSADCDIQIFQNPNEFNIPSFSAYILDKSNVFYSNQGYGAHLNPAKAIISAIVEAAQGRLTMISGSREDNFRYDYTFIFDVGETIQKRCIFELQNSSKKDFNDFYFNSFIDVNKGLSFVSNLLINNGYEKILVADLSKVELYFPVVKVLIPGLCGYHLKLNSRLNNYYNKFVK